MASKQLILPANRAFNSDGAPAVGAVLSLYETGTLTPATMYEDSALTIPIGTSITANSAGRFTPMPYQDSATAFRIIITDASGATLDDVDPFYFGQADGVVGPQGPAGDVAKALTRTELAAIVGATSGMARQLVESGREGMFIFDSTNHATDVANDPQQGIYVAPSSDTTGASGAWVRKPAGFRITPYMFGAQGGYTSVASALSGTDDTTAVQAMFNFWKVNPQYIPDLLAKYWTISSTITVQQLSNVISGATVERTVYKAYGGTLVAKTGSSGTYILLINAPNVHLAGHWGAIGPGDAVNANAITYASRSWTYGIYLVDSSGIRIDSWYAANVQRWGFDATPENMANLGNQFVTLANQQGINIGVRVGPGNGFNCGSAAGQTNGSQLTYTITGTPTRNGVSGSTSQTETVQFVEALDPNIQALDAFTYNYTLGTFTGCSTTNGSTTVTVGDATGMLPGQFISGTGIAARSLIVTVNSATSITISAAATATNASVTLTTYQPTAYSISSVDFVGNTVTFYGWLPSTVAAGQTMDSAHGGLLRIHGSNSGEGQYGSVEGIRHGITCEDSGLYGSHVGSIHGEAVGIAHAVGNPLNGACYGGSTKGIHTESGYLMLFAKSISPSGRLIGTSSANGNGIAPNGPGYWMQFYHQRPRYTNDKLTSYGSHGLVFIDGNGAVVQNTAGPSSYATAAAAITISNRPSEQFFRTAYPANTTPTVTLNWYDEYNEISLGKNWMGFELQGSQAGRNALSQVTVQLASGLIAAGWTLNGGTAALVYTQMKGPIRGIAIVDVANKNFKFEPTGLRPIGDDGTAVNGDAAATLTAGTSAKYQIWNTPLTAARAVTLSTTGAIDGDEFEIVRTAAATGAFNLNVGSGPLKALTAAGQGCLVRYSSTLGAWYEARSWSL